MSVTILTQFDSAVVKAHQDVFTKSYIEGRNTIIEFALRKRDYQNEFDTESNIYWHDKSYCVDVHEFSTLLNPIIYRFILAQGYYCDEQNNRIYFTPKISEVSTQQHMSKSVIRLACFLSVMCGVTLRNIALIFSVLLGVSHLLHKKSFEIRILFNIRSLKETRSFCSRPTNIVDLSINN